VSRAAAAAIGRALLAALLVCSALASAAAGDERVEITATDGVQLVGHLAGEQGPGVVFAHTYRADQRSWTALAQELAHAGFRTLTFDFRGYGESGGEKDVAAIDRDLEGAYRFMIGRKIRPVYLVGASMGGTAALVVAARVPVAGVATLSAPVAFRGLDAEPALAKLHAQKLFVAAEGDTAAAAAARHLATATPDPKTIDVVAGSAHGTELLAGEQKDAVTRALRAFLTAPAAP
jgi:pimeloyl-ACP methyl ester carboxylesterase